MTRVSQKRFQGTRKFRSDAYIPSDCDSVEHDEDSEAALGHRGSAFLATMINYLDRTALSIVSVDVRREFHLNEQDYSHVLTLFLFAYAIMYAGSGYVVDRLGTRLGFAVFMFSWSAAQMLHAFAVGKWSLGAFRFMLGLAEPGNWPAAAKAVAEWFPARQRALGIGIFNAGSSIGSAIAPYLVATITYSYGWRMSFIVTGAWNCLARRMVDSLRSSCAQSMAARRRDSRHSGGGDIG